MGRQLLSYHKSAMFQNEDLEELEKHKDDKTHLGAISRVVLELIEEMEANFPDYIEDFQTE